MSLSNGVDTRASSLVGQIDAAIERVVAHFEDSDIALRADVLRALAAQAKLAFETERMRQRLRQHPLTRDLIDAISTQSTVFARLADGLSVQEFSCEYDAQRNVEILTTVRWLLAADSASPAKVAKATAAKRTKKKQKTQSPTVDRSVPLTLRYAYSRRLVDDDDAATTIVEFRATVSVGDAAAPLELVAFAMSSAAPYPRSFYDDVNNSGDVLDDDDDDESDAGGANSDGRNDDKRAATVAIADDEDKDDAGSDAGSEDSAEHADPHGEAVEAFHFDADAADAVLQWLGEDAKSVDAADVFGFFLALPVAEDEWQIDERITEIVFRAGSDDDNDDDEDDCEGGEDED